MNRKRIVGKAQVHKWLDVHYGKPKICEGKHCRGNATWYDWALKHGRKYHRTRANFRRLCRSCHRRYDLTEKKKLQGEKNLWWTPGNKTHAKMTPATVKELRKLYDTQSNMTIDRLAAKFHISPSGVWQIIHKWTWKNVT